MPKSEFLRRFIHAAGSYLATIDANCPYELFFGLEGVEHCLWYAYQDVYILEEHNRKLVDFILEVVRDYKAKIITLNQALERLNEVERLRSLDGK